MGLPDGRKSFKIGLAVLIQYRRVTDTRPTSQPRCRSKYRAYYVARVIIRCAGVQVAHAGGQEGGGETADGRGRTVEVDRAAGRRRAAIGVVRQRCRRGQAAGRRYQVHPSTLLPHSQHHDSMPGICLLFAAIFQVDLG